MLFKFISSINTMFKNSAKIYKWLNLHLQRFFQNARQIRSILPASVIALSQFVSVGAHWLVLDYWR